MKIFAILSLICLTAFTGYAADSTAQEDTGWKPEPATEVPLALFHSINALSLPTAQTLKKGEFFYSIEHRWTQPISTGSENLWGFDGGVIMRMMLGYAPTDDLFISLARSNQFGQYELDAKYKVFAMRSETLPLMATIKAGGAYNSKGFADNVPSSRKYQYYGSAILNTMVAEKFGFGFVASYLYNTKCDCAEAQTSLTAGLYAQYYINENWSIILEGNPTMSGFRNKYDSWGGGVEFETGGHFFKFTFSNNVLLNTTQYLGGSADSPQFKNLHLGFQISRDL